MHDSILKLACEWIHKAIHSKDTYVSIGGERYPVIIAPNGCRAIKYKDITFIAQDKNKRSSYAKRALEGEFITWGISNKEWIRIDKDGIYIPYCLKAKEIFSNVVTLIQ